jgi:hypothetical protein
MVKAIIGAMGVIAVFFIAALLWKLVVRGVLLLIHYLGKK